MMTHRLEDDAYDDPREALKFEASRVSEIQKKKRESIRWAAMVRASRVAEGMDALAIDALGAKK